MHRITMYVAHDVNQGDRESRDGDCTKSRNGRREQREQRRVCGAGEKTTEVALAENFKDGASAKAPFACARPPGTTGHAKFVARSSAIYLLPTRTSTPNPISDRYALDAATLDVSRSLTFNCSTYRRNG